MLKYRPHRGSLAAAMEEVSEYGSIEQLKSHLNKEGFKYIEFEWYCYDKRISWNTYLVTSKGSAIGFTDGIE